MKKGQPKLTFFWILAPGRGAVLPAVLSTVLHITYWIYDGFNSGSAVNVLNDVLICSAECNLLRPHRSNERDERQYQGMLSFGNSLRRSREFAGCCRRRNRGTHPLCVATGAVALEFTVEGDSRVTASHLAVLRIATAAVRQSGRVCGIAFLSRDVLNHSNGLPTAPQTRPRWSVRQWLLGTFCAAARGPWQACCLVPLSVRDAGS